MPSSPRSWSRLRPGLAVVLAGIVGGAASALGAAPAPVSGGATSAPADADDPFSRTVTVDGLEVRTTIRATGYRWTFTNRRGSPVLEISVPVRHTAGIVPPDGWSYELVDDVIAMRADRAGLGTGRSMTLVAQTPFDLARVTTGAVRAVRIGGEPFEVAGVWVPGPKRASAWWLVAAGVVGIGVVHLAVVELRSRRRGGGGG
jgi:hypothetical protein